LLGKDLALPGKVRVNRRNRVGREKESLGPWHTWFQARDSHRLLCPMTSSWWPPWQPRPTVTFWVGTLEPWEGIYQPAKPKQPLLAQSLLTGGVQG
jgi:hypothetical protein